MTTTNLKPIKYSLQFYIGSFANDSLGPEADSPTPFGIAVGDYIDSRRTEFFPGEAGSDGWDVYRVTALKHSFAEFDDCNFNYLEAVIVPANLRDDGLV